jgi:hypothetical protein
VVVHLVHLAERAPHLSNLEEEAARQGGEGDESFFYADLIVAEGQEEVGPSVRIHDGLE